ncbi:MAG: DUF4405 domain-containing protein [Crenarchaeota archaeon]|nr:DUF4405 domain-containing protein [Thermoproteota archaeon]
MNIYTVRRIVSICLLISAILVFISGIILYLRTTHVLYRAVVWIPGWAIDNIHVYAGFVVSGLAIIHVYLNWNALKSYFKRKK